MSGDDPVTQARTTIEVVREVISGAANDPQVKVAAYELGKTAVTLTKAINAVLLPLAAINYAVEKARAYFESRFREEFAEVAKEISPGDLVEPKASLAGPLLQALAFSHEEQDLKQMYLHLLASGMDRRRQHDAHPSFVEIIKQLSSEDAHYLKSTIASGVWSPIVEVRLRISTGLSAALSNRLSFGMLARHLQDVVDSEGKRIEYPRLPAIIENLCRLGLVEVDYSTRVGKGVEDEDRQYAWVEQRPELCRLRQEHGDKVFVVRGTMKRTDFGAMFATAVGLTEPIPQSEKSLA